MAEIIRRRTGNICRRWANGKPYWVACITVDKVRMCKSSKSRAVVEAWLAGILAARPTYVFYTNPPEGSGDAGGAGHAVATLLRDRRDRPDDRRLPHLPEGGLGEARAAAMGRGCGVLYRARRMDGLKFVRTWDR